MTKSKKTIQEQTFSKKILTTGSRFSAAIRKKSDSYLARRPHRSFRRTRRRDYARSLKLPGYFAFTAYVRKTLWVERKTFLLLGVIYALLTAVLVGMASQEIYTSFTDTLRDAGSDLFEGDWGGLERASVLFATTISGGLTNGLSDLQQVYAVIIGLMAWLTTVWLLRNILAGHKVKLRDGLYNATAPLLSTFLVAVVLLAQLLPVTIALIGYSAATASGLLAGGVEAMLFWIAAGLLALMSLYWITSTFIALVVVTLPGMYPFQALKTAGDMVVGRRVRILLRLLWLVIGLAVAWVVVIIPVILFDTWLKGLWPSIEWVPIIPTALLIMGSFTTIWSASYIYLLYRKVVADDAAPA